MKTKFPDLSPVSISASIIRVAQRTTINLVPLHSPSLGARFLSRIIGHPTLTSSLKGGNPLHSNEFRNSFG